jgi:hypothetical protein
MGRHGAQADPPLKPMKVELSVTWDGTCFHYEPKHEHKDHGEGHKIKAPKSEGCLIQFKLKPRPPELDIQFDTKAPFFVREGVAAGCPDSLNSAQIEIDCCDADELAVIDWNYEKCDLQYQINFVTSQGTRCNPYDPVIQNTGGGIKPSSP